MVQMDQSTWAVRPTSRSIEVNRRPTGRTLLNLARPASVVFLRQHADEADGHPGPTPRGVLVARASPEPPPPMPRPAPRTRILSAGAGAAATVAALSLVLSPPAEVDPLGALGRANAASSPVAAPEAPVPVAFGVTGIDLARLGYAGPDLGAVSLASLSGPFSALPTERAADIRDRIATAMPHLQGLHQAKNLLGKSVAHLDHAVHAAKVAVVDAEDALAGARARLAEAEAAAAPEVQALAATPPAADPADAVAQLVHEAQVRAAVVDAEAAVAAADQARLAAWDELEARRDRRRAHKAARAAAEHETWRIDAHVRWLEYEQWLAQGAMPSAGNWLVLEERGQAELPIVEVRGFRVHRALADSVRQLVDSAAAAGIDLRGSAHRPSTRQIQLRRQNCGSTDFDIFHKSPGLCSPPTARPGRSLHELGLALDLQNGENSIVSRRDPAFRWLAEHAPSYGLYNLPSEPWHWSITGQ